MPVQNRLDMALTGIKTPVGTVEIAPMTESGSGSIGGIGCDQSAVAMRLSARLARNKLALLSRSSVTARTADSERLFRAECFFHREMMP